MNDIVILKDGFVSLSDFDSLTVRVPETGDDIRPIEYISKEFCYANCLEELTSFLTEVYAKEKPKVLVSRNF